MKLYFDSLTTLKVIHAESPIVIFFGTYGTGWPRKNGMGYFPQYVDTITGISV